MRHLRPTLLLVAALGLFVALAAGRAYQVRQADLAGLPSTALALLPAPRASTTLTATLPVPQVPRSVTLLLLTGADPAAVGQQLTALDRAGPWVTAALAPEPGDAPARLGAVLTGAPVALAGPVLYPPVAGPLAALRVAPDNLLTRARAAGRSVACLAPGGFLSPVLDAAWCSQRADMTVPVTGTLVLAVARAAALTPAAWAALVPISSTRVLIVVAEPPIGAPAAARIWVAAPGAGALALPAEPARADIAATVTALLGVAPAAVNRGRLIEALLGDSPARLQAARLALARQQLDLAGRLLLDSPEPAFADTVARMARTLAVAEDDLRLDNPSGAERLLSPALAQLGELLSTLDAARGQQSRDGVALPALGGLLALSAALAWLITLSPAVGLGRRLLLVALSLGGGTWLAAQAVLGWGGAWALDRYFSSGPDGVLTLAGGSALAALVGSAGLGLLFRRLTPARLRDSDQQFIPLPSTLVVQRLRARSPRSRVLALGAVTALGALSAATAWSLILGWSTGGPAAEWAAMPPAALLAAHLAGLLGLVGAGLAAPLAPWLAWICYHLRDT